MRRRNWAGIVCSGLTCTLASAMMLSPVSMAQTDSDSGHSLRVLKYSVRQGDSLSKLANEFHTNESLLSDINHISDTNVLKVGQIIKIIPNCTAKHASIYQVQTGDTIWDISKKFHTEMSWIIPENSNGNTGLLKPGTHMYALQNVLNDQQSDAISAIAPATEKLGQSAPTAYAKSFLCTLTAYGPGYQSTGKNPGDPGYGITSSGKVAKENETIAVDPTVIPLGSLVYIEGIGYRKAEDTGGAIKGNHIDVFFSDEQQAVRFGVKKAVKVFLIK
ncbi:LysM peptidoglycan-binding domain-containing protein [Fodinisporobacter ferrooxydans]|uniref:LysM peptidoglycan-binding domain-containing protein n=1 Tax=Fodinisporobacter ferrooxydans TaxID=2901836 RepID=A0ABY4CJ59_9BACL|nr:LysM peptidoglycan-binding domain-containing protein [Alicyclobacillaceae bacterium MYW30-H2]